MILCPFLFGGGTNRVAQQWPVSLILGLELGTVAFMLGFPLWLGPSSVLSDPWGRGAGLKF